MKCIGSSDESREGQMTSETPPYNSLIKGPTGADIHGIDGDRRPAWT